MAKMLQLTPDMRNLGRLVLSLSLLSLSTPAVAGDGKKVFTEHECGDCHGVKAAGIAEPKAAKEDKGPDLSGIVAKRGAEWIGRYLKKKEKIDGVKHKKKFRGSKDELKALVDWLSSLKSTSASSK